MKTKISRLIWLALPVAILPAISFSDGLPNQILWNKDGAEMSYIPAGWFEMGDHSFSQPVHTVTLDGFYMDFTCILRGFSVSYAWILFASCRHPACILHKYCMDSAWILPGFWVVSACLMHRICMDPARFLCGSCMIP